MFVIYVLAVLMRLSPAYISLASFLFLQVLCAPVNATLDPDIPDVLDPPEAEEESTTIKHLNPMVEMMRAYRAPVEVEVDPAWGLTEMQLDTLSQPPYWVVKNGYTRCYYPEDTEPTAEQIADGSALTKHQRTMIRRARLRKRQEVATKARIAAEAYNRKNSAALAAIEKTGLHIVIQLSKQRGTFMQGNKTLRSFRVCSGKRSTPTPKGHFHVMEKHKDHRSNLYNSAMPFFMRLTLDGVGLHQGPMRSVPSSHGCIRLHYEDARYLFNNCEVGTPVFVTD